MKIGFLLPGPFAVGNPGNGVRAQAVFQAEALERLGHRVVRLNPWETHGLDSFDVVQFFVGGLHQYGIERRRPDPIRTLIYAPIIDSNEPNKRYRMAARVGGLHSKVFTIPGVIRDQAMGSDLVVVRSSFERERLIHGVGINPDKIRLVLNGVDPPPPGNPASVREKFDLPEAFCLHVSAYTQARKNALRLIDAVGPTGLPLVLAGHAPDGTELDRLKQSASRYPTVRLLGWMEPDLLNDLYAACKVFCLPSTHEGTGLSALEAAAHGARVVITRHGGPPDYFLDWAQYTDHWSTQSIRDAVLMAWDAPASDRLKDRVLSELTWDRSARQLVEAYQSILP